MTCINGNEMIVARNFDLSDMISQEVFRRAFHFELMNWTKIEDGQDKNFDADSHARFSNVNEVVVRMQEYIASFLPLKLFYDVLGFVESWIFIPPGQTESLVLQSGHPCCSRV
jgi:hypothetical protein